ncbi:enoyl-CoA hydratase/isomerase family protein [Mycolicibacterium tokaiense]|uniref:Probable enoyl-CoA hydratase EchA17 n=1 Tax=Mycolicibacterium tokaiense TaxID=39695 RepID=A0A378TH79_9MYCO|nr:enoyl-CoA hydratase/isomerase family protein [Mycolicibacterium tokaiense]BBY86328.1 enoyl-CoA hydratase [Mycolicibacterium tokaiense]STZ59163.1 enoyl-CoA hydratase [Mycolicibacterium tokaiense]
MTSDGTPGTEVGEDRVAVITLRRPEVLNALDSSCHRAIGRAIVELERNDRVGAIVIAGQGRAFCSGSDLSEIGQLTGQAEQDYVALDFATKNRIAGCIKPVIAAVHGYCVGGGLELALACDFRVAAQDAIFMLPEVTLGSLPGSGGLQRLPRIVGVGVATDWILTGRKVDAQEAHRHGLVARLVPTGEHLLAARRLAAELAGKSALAMRLAKVALTPEPLADRGMVAAFQMLAGDAGHRQPSYSAATKKFEKNPSGRSA